MSPQPIISGSVSLSIGTNHIHVYLVPNTLTQFANTICIVGAPSPPLITLPQAQRNDEGHHSHSWIKRLAEKLFGRGLALREPSTIIFNINVTGSIYITNNIIYNIRK